MWFSARNGGDTVGEKEGRGEGGVWRKRQGGILMERVGGRWDKMIRDK